MNDNILNAGLLALIVAMAVAAVVSPDRSGRPATVAAADMPVVMLPAVVVAGKRQAPADALAAASKAARQVVQLPLVVVSGRRVPALETLTLAHAQ